MASGRRGTTLAKRTALAGICCLLLLSLLLPGMAPAQDSPRIGPPEPQKESTPPALLPSGEPVRLSSVPAIAGNNEAVRLSQEGRRAEAEQAYRAALEIKFDDDLVRAKIANNLATFYQRLDRYSDAERMFRLALDLRQKNLPAASTEVGYALNNLAQVYVIEDRDWEARKLLETARQALEASGAPGLPIVLSNLALVLCRFRQFDQAEELIRSALTFYDEHRLTASRGYGLALNNLGLISEVKNNLRTAAEFYGRAIGIFENLGEAAKADLAASLADAGALDGKLDRVAEARQAEQRALELVRPDGDTLLRAEILWNLGDIAAKAGNPAEALPYFEQSLVIHDAKLGAEHPSTAGLLLDYAAVTKRAGNKPLSRKLRKRAQDLLARLGRQPSLGQMTVSLRDLRNSR
jgi:tetratricopeptide (TPR) repeat protein